MNILLITYEFPPVGGGTGKAAYYTAREFVKMGHRAAVLTIRFKDQKNTETIDGIEVFRIPALRKKLHQSNPREIATFSLSGIFHVINIYNKFDADIALAYFTIPSGVISLWLKILKNVPYITLLRGQDVPGWLPKILKRYHAFCKPFIRYIWRNSKKVVANSAGLKSMAMKTSPDLDILSISNGVDTNKYFPAIQKNKSGVVTILFTGRLRFQKGLPCLIEGVDMLKHDKNCTKRFCLKLAGYGPEEVNLRSLVAKKKLEKEVIFLDHLDEEDLIREYQAADVFVNPSFNEGMPNSMLEAMACGLPCVATDIEGNNELIKVGHNGFLIPQKDAPALANALLKLIEDDMLRERMGKESRKIIIENFSWEKTAKKLEDLVLR